MKAFSTSRAVLLQELRNLSKAINETVDLTGLTSQHEVDTETANADSHVSENMQNVSKVHLLFELLLCSAILTKYIYYLYVRINDFNLIFNYMQCSFFLSN